MSQALINATIGGTLVVSGTTTLGNPLFSNSSITTTGNITVGNVNVSGIMNANYLTVNNDLRIKTNSSLFVGTTGESNYVKYDGNFNTISVQGGTGGRLGTTVGAGYRSDIIEWKTTGPVDSPNSVIINGNSNLNGNVSIDGTLFIKENSIVLVGGGSLITRGATQGLNDFNYIKYDDNDNTISIQGETGGKVGTMIKSNIVSWNTTGTNPSAVHKVDINGNLTINGNSSITGKTTTTGIIDTYNGLALNNNKLLIKEIANQNHFIGYNGALIDGITLQGGSGIVLGTPTSGDTVRITDSEVKFTSNISIGGQNAKSIYLKNNGDQNHKLGYNATSDGPALQGLTGGRLGTTAKTDILTWNTTGTVNKVDINGNLALNGNCIITGKSDNFNVVALNYNKLLLKEISDPAHFLAYNATSDGPALQGYTGGRLGSTVKTDILSWNTTAGIHKVDINGNLTVTGKTTVTGIIDAYIGLSLNSQKLLIKEPANQSHFIGYNGTLIDGITMQGGSGIVMGTQAQIEIIRINDTEVKSTLNLSVLGSLKTNTNIQNTTSGYFQNFYRKTNCTTSETFDFQSFHGKYEILYNANHDRNTSGFYHLDVLNNVNGGSYVLAFVFNPSGLTASINTSTNILTMNCTVSGGTFQVNRLMSYL